MYPMIIQSLLTMTASCKMLYTACSPFHSPLTSIDLASTCNQNQRGSLSFALSLRFQAGASAFNQRVTHTIKSPRVARVTLDVDQALAGIGGDGIFVELACTTLTISARTLFSLWN